MSGIFSDDPPSSDEEDREESATGDNSAEESLPVPANEGLPERRAAEESFVDQVRSLALHHWERRDEYARRAREGADRAATVAREQAQETAAKVDWEMPEWSPSAMPSSALIAIVLALALVASGVMLIPSADIQPSPGESGATGPAATETPKSGSVMTQTPDQGEGIRRVSRSLPAEMNPVPESHINVDEQVADAEDIPEPDTVRASAGSQTMTVEALERENTTQLVLSDDDTHDGRWVSVTDGWLDKHVGRVPSTVQVEHSSGNTYYADVRQESGEAAFYVRNFSSNTITFEEKIEVTGRFGDGSSASYVVEEPSLASDPNVTLRGVETTMWDNTTVSGATDGELVSLAIEGNAQPHGIASATAPTVRLTGTATTFAESRTGTGFTDGQSTTISVNGDGAPQDQSVTFTGASTSTARSVDGSNLANGDTISYSVDGNRDANAASVTFIGDSSSTSNVQSGVGISVDGSDTINTNGNLDPSGPSSGDPQLTITPNSRTVGSAYYSVTDPVGGKLWGSDGSGGYYQKEIGFQNAPAQITEIEVEISQVEGPVTGDVYIESGGPDGDLTGGTYVASTTIDSTGTKTITLNSPYEHDGGDIHIGLVATSAASGDTVQIQTTNEATVPSQWMYYEEQSSSYYKETAAAVNLTGQSATGLSVTASDGTSANLGAVHGSESVALPISSSASSLDFSATSGGTIDYTLDKTDRYGTENPSIDVDGDGDTDASYNGVLLAGETWSANVGNLSPGSYTATVSTGYQTDATINYTERTATIDPEIDLNGDGSADAAYNGVLLDGETATVSLSGLQTGSQTVAVNTGHQVDWNITYDRVEHSSNVAIDVGDDDSTEATVVGPIAPGETVMRNLTSITRSTSEVSIGTGDASTVDVDVLVKERATTSAGSVLLNGDAKSFTELGATGATELTLNASSLADGTNTVSISLVEPSAAGPQPRVDVNYSHETTRTQSVQYDSGGLTESYDVTRTFPSKTTNGTLTIPFEGEVMSIQSLEFAVNGSSLVNAPESAYSLNQTTLTVDTVALASGENESTVAAGTTLRVTAAGIKIRSVNSSVTVLESTSVGSDLNSRIRIDSWGTDAYLGVGDSAQGELVLYGSDASYSGASEYVIDDGTEQRLILPNVPNGGKITLKTLPVILEPQSGDVRASVPESISNESRPALNIGPGSSSGDDVDVEYVNADDGVWYGVIDKQTGGIIDRSDSGTYTIDDSDRTVVIERVDDPSTSGEVNQGAGGLINALDGRGNILPLSVIFGGVALMLGAGQSPARTRETAESLVATVERNAERLPAGSSVVTSAARSTIMGIANGLVTIGTNQLLTTAVGGIAVIGTVQAGLIKVGPETEAIGAVAGIGIVSIVILRELEAFSTARWIAIVGVSGVLALQSLGETDLISAIVNSEAFIIVALIGGYAVIQLVREYRANNSPDEDRPQVVIDAGSGTGDNSAGSSGGQAPDGGGD